MDLVLVNHYHSLSISSLAHIHLHMYIFFFFATLYNKSLRIIFHTVSITSFVQEAYLGAYGAFILLINMYLCHHEYLFKKTMWMSLYLVSGIIHSKEEPFPIYRIRVPQELHTTAIHSGSSLHNALVA